MTDRTELEALLTLPPHQIVEVQFKRPDIKLFFKCGFELPLTEELDEGGLVVSEFYDGSVNAVARGVDIGSTHNEFIVGRITRIVDNPKQEAVGWLVAKVEETQHKEFINQESRIADLNQELDNLWKHKDGTTKLDVLFDEYLAAKQAEAAAENDSLE